MRTVDHTLRYPGAGAEQVFAMLADPAFRAKVLQAQQVLSHDVEIEPVGDGMRVRIEQVKATEGVPSFAQRFIGTETTVIQEEDWSSPTEAAVTVTIPGQPGEISGDVRVTEDADGTRERVRLDVSVRIPLVGGRIEAMIADMLIEALRVEESTGKDWLA